MYLSPQSRETLIVGSIFVGNEARTLGGGIGGSLSDAIVHGCDFVGNLVTEGNVSTQKCRAID